MVYSTKTKKDEEEWIDLHGKRKKKWQEPKKKTTEWVRGISEGSFERQRGVTLCLFFVGNSNVNELLQNCGGFQIPSNHAHDILHKPPPKFLQHISTTRKCRRHFSNFFVYWTELHFVFLHPSASIRHCLSLSTLLLFCHYIKNRMAHS